MQDTLTKYYVTERIGLKSNPDVLSETTTIISKGENIELMANEGDWSQIQYNNNIGYLPKNKVDFEKEHYKKRHNFFKVTLSRVKKIKMKKIYFLLIVLTFLITSCEKETISEYIEPIQVELDKDSLIIEHFFDLNILSNSQGNTFEPKRLRGEVKIYFDTTVSEIDREVIRDFYDSVSTYIQGSGVTFVYTNDINDFTIGIVNGTPEYMNSVFDSNAYPQTWQFGSVSTRSECNTITKKFMWYNRGGYETIRHELGHTIGLGHAEFGKSLMYTDFSNPNSTSILMENDIAAIKLLYYEGQLGSVSPDDDDECTEDDTLLYDHEVEPLKLLLKDIIENDYQ